MVRYIFMLIWKDGCNLVDLKKAINNKIYMINFNKISSILKYKPKKVWKSNHQK